MKGPILFLATGAYAGYVPVAPGTAGSLVGMVIFLAGARHLAPLPFLFLIAGLFLAGTWAAHKAETYFAKKDPGPIVIDEIVGMLISVWGLSTGPGGWVLAFFLFRAFDILKPFPIRTIEERIPGGLGIMLDDVMAGILTNVCTRFLLREDLAEVLQELFGEI